MAASGIYITVDATTAQFDRALAAADKSLLRYSSQLKLAQKAQLEFDAAVAASGASSAEAAAAQGKLGAALARTTVAEQRAAIAAKQAGEIQAAASAKAAAAAEAAAVRQAAAFRKVGTVAGSIGTLAAVGLGLAAKAASDFNAQMAKVATLSGASASQVAALAKAAGGFADIGISATEAADAEVELVKAGVSVKDIMGGALQGALQLAAAGQLAVGDAASIAAQAMTQFGLAGKDLPHIADLLSAGANKALGSVQDLGVGLSYAGGPAHQLGVTIEDTVATLAEFAQAGLIGEKGGAALQTMFARLVKPTAAAADELKKYNISLYDSKGNFVGMSALAGQLQKGLSGVSLETRNAALQTIFGNRAFRAAAVLYRDGADGAAAWAKKVDDAGNAARTTAGQMDSLRGDLQKMSAEFQNAAIDLGQRLQPALREVTQDLTALVGVIDRLPGPVKDFGANMALATAAVGLGVFAFTRLRLAGAALARTLGVVTAAEATAGEAGLLMSTRTALAANKMLLLKGGALAAAVGLATLNSHVDGETTSALLDIATGAAAGTAVLPGWGTAVGAAAGTAYALTKATTGTTVAIVGFTESLNQSTGAATAATRSWALNKALDMAPLLDKAGVSVATFTKALLGAPAAMNQVRVAAALTGGVVATFLTAELDAVNGKAADFKARILAAAAAVGELHNPAVTAAEDVRHLGWVVLEFGVQSESAGTNAHHAAEGSDAVGKAAAVAAREVLGLTLAQRGLDAAFADSIGSVAALTLEIHSSAAATKSLSGVMNKSGTAINAQSVAGATLIQNLTGISSAALAVTGGQKRQAEAVDVGRRAIISQAVAAGASIPVARALAQSLLTVGDAANKIPPKASVDVSAPGADDAYWQLQRVLQSINAMHDVNVNVNTSYTHSGVQIPIATGGYVKDGTVQRFPRGGYVRGPGTGTSDSIPARISNGEYVVKAAAVQRYGVDMMHAINQMRAPVPYANGGMVGGSWAGRSQNINVQAILAPGTVLELRTDVGTFETVIKRGAQAVVKSHQSQINRRDLAGSSQ